MKTRVMVTITGLVQGVNFRWYTQQTAQGLNVNGWVRNLPDGSVQGCFEGEDRAVASLVEWCHKGPSSARVSDVTVTKGDFTGEFDSFSIAR